MRDILQAKQLCDELDITIEDIDFSNSEFIEACQTKVTVLLEKEMKNSDNSVSEQDSFGVHPFFWSIKKFTQLAMHKGKVQNQSSKLEKLLQLQSHLCALSGKRIPDDILLKLAILTLRNDDFQLFMSYLLSLDEESSKAKQLFDSLLSMNGKSHDFMQTVCQNASWYFSVSIIKAVEKHVDEQWLIKPMAETVSYVQSKYSQSNADVVVTLLKYIKHYQELLEHVNEAAMLTSNIKQLKIDAIRFSNDEEYRKEVILELAASTEEKNLQRALDLASENNFNKTLVLSVHFKALMQSLSNEEKQISLDEIRNRVEQFCLPYLNKNPQEALKALKPALEKTQGTDSERLRFLYELMSICEKSIDPKVLLS